MQFNLPRWNKGSKITHADLNALAEAIERIARIDVDTSSGLQLTENKSGRQLAVVPQRVASWAVVTTTITAFSGNTFGVGAIMTGYKDDSGNFVSDGSDPVPCYNNTLVSVPASSSVVIQVKWVADDWAVDVVPCSGGTS